MTKSVKQDILALMYSLTKNTDNQIMISTAAGTYIGNFVPEEKNDKDSAVYTISNELQKHSFSIKVDSNLDMIVLVDVTLLSHSHQKFKMPFVYLFTDQIISVSLGTLSFDQ